MDEFDEGMGVNYSDYDIAAAFADEIDREILAEDAYYAARDKKKDFPDWFGKGCKYFCGQWEGTEYTEGPDYMEYEPILCHCSHKDNYSDYEGNCNTTLCPKKNMLSDDLFKI